MKVILFDTETTGLSIHSLLPPAMTSRIIEFYGCLIDDEIGPEPIAELDFICDPEMPIEPIITKITGLTNADLKGRPKLKERLPEVQGLFKMAPRIVAHNIQYDYTILEHEVKRLRAEPLVWPLRKTCTVAGTEHLKGHRLKLIDLHRELFGEGFPEAHRAKNDVTALARIWCELIKRQEI
jgi:DNA polymerase III epsilon subunit-like protein